MMGQLLSLAVIGFGSTLVMMVLAPYARRCAARSAAFDTYMAAAIPAPPRLATAAAPSLASIPPEETASHHLKKVVNHGLLGALYLTVLPAAFVLNSQILAEGFEVVFDRSARLITEIPVVLPGLGQLGLSITDFQAYGIAMALAQVLLGASLGEDWESAPVMRWLVLLAGEVPFLAFMCWAAWERGHILAEQGDGHLSPLNGAVLSGLQAYVLALVDALSGRWVVHRFVLPLLRGLAWSAVSPARGLLRAFHRRRLERGARPVLECDPRAPGKPGRLTRAAAYVDAGLFEPLRQLDSIAGRMLRLR